MTVAARRLRVLAFALLASALLGGAVPAPAQEDAPQSGGFDPADLLERLGDAARRNDHVAYLACLADTFDYVPLPTDVINNPDLVWDGWDQVRERTYVRRAAERGRLAFPRVIEVNSRTARGRDDAEWDVTYELAGKFRARAVLTMVRSGVRWYLRGWEDIDQVFDADGEAWRGSAEQRALVMR